MLVVLPSKFRLALSNTVNPGVPTDPKLLILPIISPSYANSKPGGNVPDSTEYNTNASGTSLVATTLSVDKKFELISPKSDGVIQLILLLTSPRRVTLKVFCVSVRSALPPVTRTAFTVNL